MNVRYYISKSRNYPVDIWSFLRSNKSDPSLKVFPLYDCVYSTSDVCNLQSFLPKLRDHILGRLLERPSQGDTYGDFSDAERNMVHILGNKLFEVSTMTVNFTSYDIRRDYDLVNPRSHPDIMIVSPDSETNNALPFWYARVLKIYHADVWTSHPDVRDHSTHSMNFLWVRWFGTEPGYNWGFSHARLPKIGFVEWNDPFAFTFLDPAHVVRGCHLIPAFAEGRTSTLLPEGKSAGRVLVAEETDDWLNFYVGMYVMTRLGVTICNDTYWIYSFADRDLMIRHHGGGIGHLQGVRVCSVDHDQNDTDMVQEDSGAAEDDTRPRGDSESNVAVESDTASETDYDMGSGSDSERSDDDFSEDEGYATP